MVLVVKPANVVFGAPLQHASARCEAHPLPVYICVRGVMYGPVELFVPSVQCEQELVLLTSRPRLGAPLMVREPSTATLASIHTPEAGGVVGDVARTYSDAWQK